MNRRACFLELGWLLAIVSLPYLLGFALAGNDWQFGGMLFNPVDGQSYLAKMNQGYMGAWRFTLPYTSSPGEGAYLFLFYLALGHLARVVSLPILLIFHLARLVGTVVMVTGLWRFYQEVLAQRTGKEPDLASEKNEPASVHVALLLALFGSGSGWLALFFGQLPSDLWVAEMYPFLSAYANPHFPMGLGLLLWLLVIFLRLMNTPGRLVVGKLLLLAGLSLLIAVIQPFGVVIVAMLVGGLILWDWLLQRNISWRPVFWGGAAVIPGGLFLLYQYLAILNDPVLSGWNAQNITTSPPLWDLVLSLTPALPLACLAIWRQWKWVQQNRGLRLVMLWLIAGVILAYLPFSLQRRFLTGYYVPVAALAAAGFVELSKRWPQRKVVIERLVFGFSIITNLFVILLGLFGMLSHAPEYYLTRDEAAALSWLKNSSPPSAVILASPELSLFIPSMTGRRVVYGHPFETVDAENEELFVKDVYHGTIQAPALENFLSERKVDLILYGEREQAIEGEPGFLDYPLAFEQGKVRIYFTSDKP